LTLQTCFFGFNSFPVLRTQAFKNDHRAPLDWERFSERAEAEASARQLMRPGEAYTIEEHDGTCQRCQETMKLKAPLSTNEASA
jgi:uncharacterized paraquat-inducible protein A